jgi:FemAB-related protein (PEP-CTERM system-associated)
VTTALARDIAPSTAQPRATTDAKSMKLNVAALDSAHTVRWDAFVQACPEATFFHRAGWQRVIERAFGHRTHFMFVERGGQIEGVLPLVEIKSMLFGHSLASTPFCVYGGPAATSDEARDALIDAAAALAQDLGVTHLELRSQRVLRPDWHHKDLYYTFRREIFADEEKNMNAIPRKQRAMVRKGIKAGLAGEIDEGVDRFFAAYSSSVHRLGTPVFSRAYFQALCEEFGKDCEILTIVQADGSLVGSVMNFYFRDEVLPYYGGGLPVARDVAGNDFMYWELTRRSMQRGVKTFDFGRSKLGTGAFDFKKNWGFEPTALPYEYKLVKAQSVPEHNPLNPKYQLMIKCWQRMPLWLANALGPMIVKNLG